MPSWPRLCLPTLRANAVALSLQAAGQCEADQVTKRVRTERSQAAPSPNPQSGLSSVRIVPDSHSQALDTSLLRRVEQIERVLGLSNDKSYAHYNTSNIPDSDSDASLAPSPLLSASSYLKRRSPEDPEGGAWEAPTIERLWRSYV